MKNKIKNNTVILFRDFGLSLFYRFVFPSTNSDYLNMGPTVAVVKHIF